MSQLAPLTLKKDWDRPTDADWAGVLAEFPLFERVGKRRLRKIVRQAEIAELTTGEAVVFKGDRGDALYIVLSGEARARWRPAARPLRRGDYFGEIAALDGGGRSATVVATTDLQVMRVPRASFLELVEADPRIAVAMLQRLGERVRRLEADRQAA
jgi:CRP/FNR family transcriptional regulator, cyclic AMP receptor protein